MSNKKSNLIFLKDTKNGSSALIGNRIAINSIFARDERNMTVYKLLERREKVITDGALYSPGMEIKSYIFLDGPTPVRWDPRFDLYEITNEGSPASICRVFDFFQKFGLFFPKAYISREITFTGIFQLSKPRWGFNKSVVILKTTEFSYAYSEVHKKKINIEKIKRMYITNNEHDLLVQEETKTRLPYSCLPTVKEDSGNIRTTENYLYYSSIDVNKVLKTVFPDEFDKINNDDSDRGYLDGNLMNYPDSSYQTTSYSKNKILKSQDPSAKKTKKLTSKAIENFSDTVSVLVALIVSVEHKLFVSSEEVFKHLDERYRNAKWILEANYVLKNASTENKSLKEFSAELYIAAVFELMLDTSFGLYPLQDSIYHDLEDKRNKKGWGKDKIKSFISPATKELEKYKKFFNSQIDTLSFKKIILIRMIFIF